MDLLLTPEELADICSSVESFEQALLAVKVSKAQLAKAEPIIRKDERDKVLRQMALERCDPDVMPYFEDYYWLPKSVWQALKEK